MNYPQTISWPQPHHDEQRKKKNTATQLPGPVTIYRIIRRLVIRRRIGKVIEYSPLRRIALAQRIPPTCCKMGTNPSGVGQNKRHER